MGKNLITGGIGFLGAYIARQLVEENEDVVLFQRRDQLPASMSDLEGKVDIVSGDIGNWVHVLDAVSTYDIETIYHSAAIMSRDCEASPANGFRVNVKGTFNVLEAARILNVKDVNYVSSAATYGINPDYPCSYIYVKDGVRGLIQLKRAPEESLRQRVYAFGGFMATLNGVAGEIKKHLPETQIMFNLDTSEHMKNQNSGVNYWINNSVATQDLDYEPQYLLEEMVADFIHEVKAGRAG